MISSVRASGIPGSRKGMPISAGASISRAAAALRAVLEKLTDLGLGPRGEPPLFEISAAVTTGSGRVACKIRNRFGHFSLGIRDFS